MEARRMENVLIIAVVTCLWTGAIAETSCSNVIMSMSPCVEYITGSSSSPSMLCCIQFASVVQSQPECLCNALNGSPSSLGVNVDHTRALAFPHACNVQTPPISSCSGTAASSPADSPAGIPHFILGTGSGTTTFRDNPTSDGYPSKMFSSAQLFATFLASSATIFINI